MRVLLLRILVGWWMTAFMWTAGWALAWLLFGTKNANEMAAFMTRAVWYGEA